MPDDYPSDWNSRRKTVYQRDNYTCQNCGRQGGPYGNTELHAHHIVPKSKGGVHETENLVTVCKQCHNAIHSDSLAPPTKGTTANSSWFGGHGKVFLLTFWWTAGLGNLAYEGYRRSKTSQRDQETATEKMQQRYGSCPECRASDSLEYGITLRRELLSPLIIRCTQCRQKFKGRRNTLRPVDAFIADINTDVSGCWYYALVTGVFLSLLTTVLPFPSLILASWVTVPTAIFFDAKYVRHNTNNSPLMPVWVWSSLLWPMTGLIGFVYLLRRYQADSNDLHQGPIWMRIEQVVAKVRLSLPSPDTLNRSDETYE